MSEVLATSAMPENSITTHSPARPQARRRSIPRGLLAAYLLLGVGGVLMIAPFGVQLVTSLKTYQETIAIPPVLPAHPQWTNYAHAGAPSFPIAIELLNTIVVAAARVFGQVFLASMAAYAFARLNFPGRRLLFAIFISVLMVPGQLFLVPQYQIMQSLGWLDSLQALFVPGIFNAFGVFLLRQFFLTLPPELEEAARLDGCNPWQIYTRVLLPLIRPAMVALGLLTLVASWNDLLWPLIVNSSPERLTVAAGLSSLIGQYATHYELVMAGAVITTAPIIGLFLVAQRQFVAGVASSGFK